MKKIDLGQTISIVANLGVLAGLILLIVELNQNRELAQAEFLVSRDMSFQSFSEAMIGANPADVWAKSVLSPESLTPGEIKVLDNFMIHRLNRWYRTWDLENRGILDHGETQQAVELAAPFLFGNKFALVWLSHEQETWPPEFTAIVNSVTSDVDPTKNLEWIESIQRQLAADPG